MELLLANEKKANKIAKHNREMNKVKVLNSGNINHSNMINASDH